ncbi:MAG: HAD family phosphatase [Atopobiaceae bacterium]|nr:HAD family phosphatase [Atopobiaceae bacterium]
MTYKLLALDMDGTLLTSDKRVLPKTRAALEQLAERGTPLAYCTGRNNLELLHWPQELPFIRYGVLASGAIIYDFAEGRALKTRALDVDSLLAALEIAQAEEVMPHVMAVHASVVRPCDLTNMVHFGMGVYQGMFERICTLDDDPASWIRANPGQVVKLNFYHTSSQARDRTRARLAAAGLPLTLANAEEGSVECSAKGVNKGDGLRILASHLGATLAEVVAVGDSDNDVAALSAVGMPVAMGNAPQEVCELARLVVADNDHDGIVEVIERLF